MDTSKQYIKMCEKAEEIQGYAISHAIHPPRDPPQCGVAINREGDWFSCNGIWLPRQDQLQEMVSGIWSHLLLGIIQFCRYDDAVKGFKNVPKLNFTSMEQLWLAFVQKELYEKIWDGENWIDHP